MIKNIESGRELDALVAEKVMGGFVPGDPEEWSVREDVWFWLHPRSGVLIGEPYWANKTHPEDEKMFSHGWRKFEPSTNIADAWLVVMAMENMGIWFELSNVIPNSDSIVYEVKFNNFYACEETAPLAICHAALLASGEGESE